MQVKRATTDDIFATTKLVEKRASSSLPIICLTEPYLSYFYSDNYRTQVKRLFHTDMTFIVTDDTNNIIGYIAGGFSVDNYDYDGEIYTLFTFVDDTDFRLRELLFKSIVSELKKNDCKSIHVEISIDDSNKDFYVDKGANFVTEISNLTTSSYQTVDFGWTDIEEIKL